MSSRNSFKDEADLQMQLSKFYGTFIKENFVLSENILFCLKAVLLSKKNVSEIQWNPPAYMLACMLKFGVHDACLSILKFKESTMECQKIVDKLCGKKCIKVCCLGMESLFAAVGICKVIDELASHYKFSGEYIQVQLYLIDRKRGFNRQCENLVSAANTLYKNIQLQKLNLVLSDSKENLLKNILIGASKSHIVVTSRCLSQSSIMNFPSKTTLDKVKKFAFVLYLDDIGKSGRDRFENVMSKSSFSKLISCKLNYTSLENLRSKQYGLQLPFSWTHKSSPVKCSVYVNYSGIEVHSALNNPDEFIFLGGPSGSDIKNMTAKPKPVRTDMFKQRIVRPKATKSAIRSKNDRHKEKAKRTVTSRYAIKLDDEY